MSSHNNGNKKCSKDKITDNEKNIMEREKKRQFQQNAEMNRLEQIAKKKEKHSQRLSIDFEQKNLYSNAVGIANENTRYQVMNSQCDNATTTSDKKLEEEAKQEMLKEKQNKRECRREMEISRLEQLAKKSKNYLSNKSVEQSYFIVLKNMNYHMRWK